MWIRFLRITTISIATIIINVLKVTVHLELKWQIVCFTKKIKDVTMAVCWLKG